MANNNKGLRSRSKKIDYTLILKKQELQRTEGVQREECLYAALPNRLLCILWQELGGDWGNFFIEVDHFGAYQGLIQ